MLLLPTQFRVIIPENLQCDSTHTVAVENSSILIYLSSHCNQSEWFEE